VKNRAMASTLKKATVLLLDRTVAKGYLNPVSLGRSEIADLLTPSGEHLPIRLDQVKSVCLVREFTESIELERKTFLSRPKLDGLWVRLRFHDGDTIEGIVSNDLLDLLDAGVHITPPDLHGNIVRMFIPRSALSEMKVLGVVGAARRIPRDLREAEDAGTALPSQPRLFTE
jgi:hypothetical protein